MSSNKAEPELPNGWCWATVGDTGRYINGFAFKPEHREPTGRPIVRIQNLTDPEKPLNRTSLAVPDDFCVGTGGLLVSWSATVDVFLWNREPALVNQHIFKVVPDENLVDRTFLFYWLKVAIDQLLDSEHLHGSTMKHINRGPFMAHRIPLPPLPEQQRLAEKLEELLSDLDAAVAELKAAQRKLTQYRHSLLKAAMEGALTADWRAARGEPEETGAVLLQRILAERRARWEKKQLAKFAEQGKPPPNGWRAKYPEPVTPNMTHLPQLPGGWAWATVDQCAIDEDGITDGPFGSNLKSEHYTESGPRVIRLQNIGDGRFQDARAHISVKHYEKLKKHAVVDGDVVVAMLGEILPRACSVPAGIAPAIVKADCARVRINAALVPADFLVVALNSEPTRKQVERLIKGVGRPRITLGNIRSIPVPLPPKSEQLHMLSMLAESLESCDVQRSTIEMGFSLSAAQRKNILKAAFAGQLVPQDPSDEPAGALLARVRAKREAHEKRPKGRKQEQQKEIAVARKLIDVLAEADDWMPAQELFRLCGVADGAQTDQVEALYAELRSLEKAGRLAVEAVADSEGRKLYDRLKLQAA
ncbi:restriction endonuclease subunit S [Luteimonas sp. 3794]|uniref:restriction endonuclease subunit S n=1 Tax=Luteimonas sp. 3794 TaxID=2817730 RepID=UPI00285BFF39|nr:restriction endonuclease subunit S [Luteimonas sp. 3794]MDR6990970.1 type I restriction enzyme S subunit [Luteimonas sp. 3794]